MLPTQHPSILRPLRKMASQFLAATAVAALAATPLAPAIATHAVASDLEVTADPSASHFVRLGLNKSAVVRLPAEARDVIVGNPDIVDAVVRTKNTAYLFARKTGQTNIFFFDGNGQQILNLDLEVALDVTAIKKLINRTLPGNKINVDTANNNIILGGTAANALEAKTALDLATQFAGGSDGGSKVINTMTVAGEDQVMLKVRVVEIQRDVLKQFGINVSALLSAGKLAFNLASVNPFAQGLLSEGGGYKATYANGSTQIEGLVRAMESDGLMRTLAEPNLTALTGQAAKFHAGGEFPYNACTVSDGVRSCTTDFKEYGVQVEFTPTVLSESRINLKINTTVSDLGSATGSDGTPSLNSRSASTVLEMPSGGSMMIAGLIKDSTRQNINGTPGLKRLPILGSLFRSRDFIANETELVIMVTPYLVRATDSESLTTPDAGFDPATDGQAIFMGRLNSVYGDKSAKPQGRYNGNVGFIVQ